MIPRKLSSFPFWTLVGGTRWREEQQYVGCCIIENNFNDTVRRTVFLPKSESGINMKQNGINIFITSKTTTMITLTQGRNSSPPPTCTCVWYQKLSSSLVTSLFGSSQALRIDAGLLPLREMGIVHVERMPVLVLGLRRKHLGWMSFFSRPCFFGTSFLWRLKY